MSQVSSIYFSNSSILACPLFLYCTKFVSVVSRILLGETYSSNCSILIRDYISFSDVWQVVYVYLYFFKGKVF